MHFGSRKEPKATSVGQRVHADICGPICEATYSGFHYFLLFKDEFNAYRHVYFVKTRDQIFDCLRKCLASYTTRQKYGHNFLRGAATDKGECPRTLELRRRGSSPDVSARGRTVLLCGRGLKLNKTRGARLFPDPHSTLVSRISFSSSGICAEQDYDCIFDA